MSIVAVGIDLAKNVFALHGVDETGKVVLRRPSIKRDQLLEFFASLPPCLVGMEACSGAHDWARKLKALGHDARMMAPKLVAPYRDGGKRKKNDAVDAEAICEAVQRKKMRFVPIKSEEQQSRLAVHTAREGYVAQRTATINRIRGLLTEVGIVMPKKAETIRKLACQHLEDLPGYLNQVVNDLLDELSRLDQRVASYDVMIREMARQDSRSKRLMQINGIGEVTASAIVALVGNGHDFKNARQFAAWLGLVPKQYSSGGKSRLGGITKQGDVYLRTLLVQGARGIVYQAGKREDRLSGWIKALVARAGVNKAVIAVAAKQARIIWAMLVHDAAFQPERIGVAA